MACNFNCCIETEGILKVTGSRVHNTTSSITKTDRNVVTTDH